VVLRGALAFGGALRWLEHHLCIFMWCCVRHIPSDREAAACENTRHVVSRCSWLSCIARGGLPVELVYGGSDMPQLLKVATFGFDASDVVCFLLLVCFFQHGNPCSTGKALCVVYHCRGPN
jgi:hypothetical protein